MKLEDLRKMGSQQLDELAEYKFSFDKLEIYENNGNGDYHLAREYRIIKIAPLRDSFVEMDYEYLERLCGGVTA